MPSNILSEGLITYHLDGLGVIPGRGENCSLSHLILTDSGAYPASSQIISDFCFLRSKVLIQFYVCLVMPEDNITVMCDQIFCCSELQVLFMDNIKLLKIETGSCWHSDLWFSKLNCLFCIDSPLHYITALKLI
jgi:hypothetical protein